jgi:uncharacterized protein (DUF58 family)
MNLAELLRQVRLLEIVTRDLVKDVLAGGYTSVFRGRGLEFSEVRDYRPGDDIRSIDWNVTARMGAPYVKRYVEERELTVLFLVDHSASEIFGTRVRTKAELAAEVCAALAMTAVKSNDRVGIALFTDRVEKFIPPQKGKTHVRRVIRELLSFEPAGAGTDLRAALEFVNRVQRRRAVLFLVSDFVAPPYRPALRVAARRHDTIAIQLVDPRERELPDVGLVTLREAETGRWMYADTSAPGVREAFRRRARAFDQELAQSFRQNGVELIRLETDRSWVGPLLAFFRRREQALRH